MSTFLSNQEWRWCFSLCPVLAILLDDHDGSIRWFLQGTSVLGGEMWGRPQNGGRYPTLKGLCWEATVSWKFTLYMLEFLDFLPLKDLVVLLLDKFCEILVSSPSLPPPPSFPFSVQWETKNAVLKALELPDSDPNTSWLHVCRKSPNF